MSCASSNFVGVDDWRATVLVLPRKLRSFSYMPISVESRSTLMSTVKSGVNPTTVQLFFLRGIEESRK